MIPGKAGRWVGGKEAGEAGETGEAIAWLWSPMVPALPAHRPAQNVNYTLSLAIPRAQSCGPGKESWWAGATHPFPGLQETAEECVGDHTRDRSRTPRGPLKTSAGRTDQLDQGRAMFEPQRGRKPGRGKHRAPLGTSPHLPAFADNNPLLLLPP